MAVAQFAYTKRDEANTERQPHCPCYVRRQWTEQLAKNARNPRRRSRITVRLESTRKDLEDGWAKQHDADRDRTPANKCTIHVLSNDLVERLGTAPIPRRRVGFP